MIKLSARQQLSLKRSLIYIITLTLITSGIMIVTHTNHALPPVTTKASDNHLNGFMQHVHAKSFNQTGAIEDTVTSSEVQQNAQTGNIVLNNPHIVATEENAPSWHIRAQHGQLAGTDKKNVDLWDHVEIRQPLGPNRENIALFTPSVHYNGNKKVASTNQAVTIIQPDSTIHGVGMIADMQHGDIKILHHTHAQYIAHSESKKET